uniref:Uncharacterized protein n=1 Tax=Rhizophora mucronata TaxID=61149 RepID=A0A2P2IUL1_RHIMU
MIPNPVFSCPKTSRDVSAPDTLSFLSMLTPYLSSSSSSSFSVLFPFCLSLFARILSSSSSPSCLLSSSQKETPRPIKNTITNQGTEWQLFPRRGLEGYEIRWHSMSVYCQEGHLVFVLLISHISICFLFILGFF